MTFIIVNDSCHLQRKGETMSKRTRVIALVVCAIMALSVLAPLIAVFFG